MISLEQLPSQGSALREIRANLTQEQAAAVCGVFINTWQNWERGRRAPPPDALEDFPRRAREMFPHYEAGAAAPRPGRPHKPRDKEPKTKKPKREPFVGPIRKVGRPFKVEAPVVPRPFQQDELLDALFSPAKEKAPAQSQG